MPRPDWDGASTRTWTSAYVKDEVDGAVTIRSLGVDGDEQVDLDAHGGPQMAVLAYCAEHYPLWRSELGLDAIGPGGFGENLTLSGVDERTTCIGDVFECGALRLQVSQPRGPCLNISRRWDRPELMQRASETARIGWYLRVLAGGPIERGRTLVRTERPQPQWSVERVFRLRLDPRREPAAISALTRLNELSDEWRAKFNDLLKRTG